MKFKASPLNQDPRTSDRFVEVHPSTLERPTKKQNHPSQLIQKQSFLGTWEQSLGPSAWRHRNRPTLQLQGEEQVPQFFGVPSPWQRWELTAAKSVVWKRLKMGRHLPRRPGSREWESNHSGRKQIEKKYDDREVYSVP